MQRTQLAISLKPTDLDARNECRKDAMVELDRIVAID
jgi:hypothetical protein